MPSAETAHLSYRRSLRRPKEERTAANKHEALSYAAYRTLVDLYPGAAQVAQFDAL